MEGAVVLLVATRSDIHDEQRNRAGEEAEQHNPQHVHIVLVSGERQDNRARQREVEHQSLNNPVIAFVENMDVLECVGADNNEQ